MKIRITGIDRDGFAERLNVNVKRGFTYSELLNKARKAASLDIVRVTVN